MKKIIFLSALCLLLSACGGEPLLEIDPEQLTFPAEGGIEQVSITASSEWNTMLESEDASTAFYSISPASGKGSVTVTVTVRPNPSATVRSEQVLVICSTHDRSVTRILKIRQEGSDL